MLDMEVTCRVGGIIPFTATLCSFLFFFYFLWVGGGGGGGGRLKMATITREVKQEQPDENSANGKSSHVFPNADRQ